ncbi:hypothetical protein [Sorangium cellulosum]|uniref:hypothetical protein n=1 Tax=Sorangium cellulosum TaxID=56 RepID=UPI001F5D404B|nr:hypothetical protein [Sorangium cellulosum]
MASQVACVGVQGLESDDVGEVDQPALGSNALTSNALTSNALTSNALLSSALTETAIASNATMIDALRDPLSREVFKYIVSCALPGGAHLDVNVDGVSYGFDGGLGLHGGWGETGGTCDEACKGWVSACVLARLNYLGTPVPLSLRGGKSELYAGATEQAEYTVREGAYYGDIFADPPVYRACLSPEQVSLERVCGPSLDDCVVTVVGSCSAACDAPRSDGSFPHCHDRPRDTTGGFPSGAIDYPSAITVFEK